MLINFINLLIVITIAQNGDTQARCLKNMTVTQGLHADKIIVEWEKTESRSYTVMRSQYKTGEFVELAQTPDTKFEDTSVEKGVKYWYKVIPSEEAEAEDDLFITDEEYSLFTEAELAKPVVNNIELSEKEGNADNKTEIDKTAADTAGTNSKETDTEHVNNTGTNGAEIENPVNGISSETPVSYSGFTSIENPSGVKLSALMKSKKAKLKTPADAEDRKRQKGHLDYIKQYYMNPVKLSLFMTLAKPYIERGDLKILADCENFEVKKDLSQVIFYEKNYNYMVVFESKKFVRIISENEEAALAEILLKNSQLFCLSSGRAFIVDKDGITRLVNTFDAVGLATGYLKDDIAWRSNTIMVATSRSDLKKKLTSASAPQKDE